MAYSNFTLETVLTTFQLEIVESADIFASIESVEPSPELIVALRKKVPVAAAINAEKGLTGMCDFLVSLSPMQSLLQTPVIALVEAKKEDPAPGLGQCIAEMLAAQCFNAEKGNDIPCIYGAATTGTEWKFLKLEDKRLHIDITVYQIVQCDKILGILSSMVKQKA